MILKNKKNILVITMVYNVDSYISIFSSILMLYRIVIIVFYLKIQIVLASQGKSDCEASKNRHE